MLWYIDVVELKGRLYDVTLQRVTVSGAASTADATKRLPSSSSPKEAMISSTSIQLQAISIGDKSKASAALSALITTLDTTATKNTNSSTSSALAECYLDIARASLRYNLLDIAEGCYTKAAKFLSSSSSVDFRVKCKADLYLAIKAIADVSISSTPLSKAEVVNHQLTNRIDALKVLLLSSSFLLSFTLPLFLSFFFLL